MLLTEAVWPQFAMQYIPGAAKQSSPLKFFAVFSATVQNFNFKLYAFIF